MKLGVADAGAARRRLAACRYDAIEETPDGGAADRRRRPQQRPRRPPRRPRALPAARAGAARRRVGPAAQPRHRRRQPAPAHALRVLPGRHEAVQQAPARLRLPGARGRPPQPRDPRRTPTHCVATHPSDMAVALAAIDAVVHVARRRRRAHDPDPRPAPAARRRARSATPCSSRRPDHRRRARRRARPARSTYRKVRDRASFAFAVVSVAARARRSTDGTVARRAGSRSAASPTSRGARDARRGGAARRPGRRAERVRARRPRPSSPQAAARCATTPSRCRWPATLIVDADALAGAGRDDGIADHRAPSARRSRRVDGPREGHGPGAATPSSTPVESLAYACARAVATSRAARSTPVDAAAALAPPAACSRCSSHDNAPRLGDTADGELAVLQSTRVALPRPDRRRGGGRDARRPPARPPPRSASTTRRASHDVELSADHPRRSTRPTRSTRRSPPTPPRATSRPALAQAAVAVDQTYRRRRAQQPDGAARARLAVWAGRRPPRSTTRPRARTARAGPSPRCSASSPSRCG